MKFHQLFSIFLSLFLTFQVSFGQEKSTVKLVYEFGPMKYDSFSLRFDDFMVALNNDLNSEGYVVIYGDQNDPLSKYYQEISLKKTISFRKFDEKRIKFLHGWDEQTLRTQLWISSDKISKPDVKEIEWDYKLPPNMKPLKVHMDSWINEVGPDVFSLGFYSKLLLANPNFRGHLVIIEKTVDNFYRTEKKLSKGYKVPNNQLKFFYVKSNHSDVEYWIVPRKNK